MSGGAHGLLPRGFGRLALIALAANAIIFVGAVAVIAYAVKWVIS